FAQPAPGLQRLGTFRPVAPEAPEEDAAPAVAQSPAPAQSSTAATAQARVPQQPVTAPARAPIPEQPPATSASRPAHWTDSLRIRGYVQTRYTSMLGGDEGINLWSDRSVGDADSLGNADKNFLIRRARL